MYPTCMNLCLYSYCVALCVGMSHAWWVCLTAGWVCLTAWWVCLTAWWVCPTAWWVCLTAWWVGVFLDCCAQQRTCA